MPVNYNLLDPSEKTFVDLMNLRQVSDIRGLGKDFWCFQSTMVPFQPASAPGVFGGHVLAQSAYAGSLTVGEEYICHNFHGEFILPGRNNVPFIYVVEKLRNGRSYSTRQIKVYQLDEADLDTFTFESKYLCFIAIGSYKAREKGVLDYQRDLEPELRLTRKEILETPVAPDVDTEAWIKWAEMEGHESERHPIDLRKSNTKEYNHNKPIADRRVMHYFRSHDPLTNNPNMHVAALLYTSDRNSLFTILNIQDEQYFIRGIASIDHSFILHDMNPKVDIDWLTMETYSDRAIDGRGLYKGRMYDPDHKLVCSFMQDGVVRVAKASKL